MRRSHALTLLSLVAALGGCGDGHEYPSGFAEQAARDEAWFKAQEEAQKAEQKPQQAAARSGQVAPPRAPIGSAGAAGSAGSAGDAAVDAPPALAAGDAADTASAAASDIAADADVSAEVAAENAAVAESRRIITDLGLPTPPPVEVAEGEEPFMKLAKERRFDEFRRMSARYVQLKRELLPYGERIASGESTAADRAVHAKIERAMEGEFPRLNRYMWDDRWTELDRAAMGWILNGGLVRRQ
jgi:hypothetical protein